MAGLDAANAIAVGDAQEDAWGYSGWVWWALPGAAAAATVLVMLWTRRRRQRELVLRERARRRAQAIEEQQREQQQVMLVHTRLYMSCLDLQTPSGTDHVRRTGGMMRCSALQTRSNNAATQQRKPERRQEKRLSGSSTQ